MLEGMWGFCTALRLGIGQKIDIPPKKMWRLPEKW